MLVGSPGIRAARGQVDYFAQKHGSKTCKHSVLKKNQSHVTHQINVLTCLLSGHVGPSPISLRWISKANHLSNVHIHIQKYSVQETVDVIEWVRERMCHCFRILKYFDLQDLALHEFQS